MTSKIVVRLGDIAFAGFEVPERMPFGGDQKLVVHELVGGRRVVDAMGTTPVPLVWSGIFSGSNALARARAIDALRIAGKAVSLTWSDLAYDVTIRTFSPVFEKLWHIPYSITCETVLDRSAPVVQAAQNVNQAIAGDMATATALASGIGNAPLAASVSTLGKAIGAVSDFAKATQATIAGVLQPLAVARGQVNTLLAAAGNTIQSVTSLGGILPNNPAARQAAKLLGQITAVNQSPMLVNLDRVLSRIGANIGAIGSSTKTVAVAGGNLYQVAAQQYGDPLAWQTIANANKMTDPTISGVQTLIIPPNPG